MWFYVAAGILIPLGLYIFVASIIAQNSGRELPIVKTLFIKDRMLWKDKVYIKNIVMGLIMLIAGIVFSTKSLW